MTWQRGWPLRDDRGQLWEFVRMGCATDWAHCPHGEKAVTVIALDQQGRRRSSVGMTSCVPADILEATLATIGPHTLEHTEGFGRCTTGTEAAEHS